MESWDLATGFIRIVGIVIVLVLTFGKSKNRPMILVILFSAIAGSVALHRTGNGADGIIYPVSGMAVAALFNLYIFLRKKISFGEFAATLAIGAIAGGTGSIFLFLIAFSMDLVQKALGAERTMLRDRFAPSSLAPHSSQFCTGRGSSLARIEAQRLIKSESIEEHAPIGVDPVPGGTGCGIALRGITLPWGVRIGLATLVILMSGLFV